VIKEECVVKYTIQG